jgi:TPR repeat protein
MKAFEYFKLAADQGDLASKNAIGDAYCSGHGIRKSYEKAFEYYKLAADQGYSKAQYSLGKCYQLGLGVEESWDEALKYYLLANKQDHPQAKKAISELKFIKNLKIMADQGDKEKQFILAKKFRQGGHKIKESWEHALHYYKLAAEQGHIEAIKFLFDCYSYGKKVEESKEEAVRYLMLGALLKDPECQVKLGFYYEQGWGNLNTSIADAFNYYQLAANQGNQGAIKKLKNMARILHPEAQEVEIQTYLQDKNISTLEAILKKHVNYPIFLEKSYYSWEEAQVIRDAMIENSRFTLICPGSEMSLIFDAFELRGYDKKKDLKYARIVNPVTRQETYGCVFVGNDINDASLKFVEEDPEAFERKRLESLAELQRKKNKNRASEIYLSLSKEEILYPDSQELNIEDRNIDTLKKSNKSNLSQNRKQLLENRKKSVNSTATKQDKPLFLKKQSSATIPKDVKTNEASSILKANTVTPSSKNTMTASV